MYICHYLPGLIDIFRASDQWLRYVLLAELLKSVMSWNVLPKQTELNPL